LGEAVEYRCCIAHILSKVHQSYFWEEYWQRCQVLQAGSAGAGPQEVRVFYVQLLKGRGVAPAIAQSASGGQMVVGLCGKSYQKGRDSFWGDHAL
jgi:hypothetical protein